MIFTQGLIAVGILLLGMGMLVYGLFFLSRALGSRSWPTAKGTITRSFVDKDNDHDVTYTAKVTYWFSVGGRESARVKLLVASFMRPTAEYRCSPNGL